MAYDSVPLAGSKVTKVNDPPYRRGIPYLLSTQFPDRSWHARSLAIKIPAAFRRRFTFRS